MTLNTTLNSFDLIYYSFGTMTCLGPPESPPFRIRRALYR